MKLVLVGALLLVALAFFFFGQSLVNAPQDAVDPSPTPASYTRTIERLAG